MVEVLEAADAITFSLHKAGGLRGQSVLVLRERARGLLAPLLRGGAQERGLRAGTESPALVAASATALALAVAEAEQRGACMAEAKAAFLGAVGDAAAENLTREPALVNTVMLRFDVPDGRALLPALDLAGVRASQGSACSSGSPSPPRVLTAMGLTEHEARCAVRFSFSHSITRDAAQRGGALVRKIVER